MEGKRDVRMSNQPLADELKATAGVIAALKPIWSFAERRRVLIAALTLMQEESLANAVRESR